MIHKILAHKVSYWLLRFIQFQLFITLISLPMITSWGLPLSLLSLLGNLIFSPVLSLFLLLGAVIFFLELAHIPIAWPLFGLELLSNFWLGIIGHMGRWPFLYFPRPPLIWCIAVPLLALICIHHKKTSSIIPNIIALSLLLVTSLMYLKILHTPSFINTTIACNRGTVTIVHTHEKTIIIDPGCIGQRRSATSWVEYTLVQSLATTLGSVTVDHLIILKLNKTTLEAITKLINLIPIKNIYLPTQTVIPSALQNAYETLLLTAQKSLTNIIPIDAKPVNIFLDSISKITIEALPKQQAHIHVIVQLNNQKTFIYPLRAKQAH